LKVLLIFFSMLSLDMKKWFGFGCDS
jgi:hypothetical protein